MPPVRNGLLKDFTDYVNKDWSDCVRWYSVSKISYLRGFLFILLCSHQSKVNVTLQWHHNKRDGVSNHQPHDCLLNRLFRRISKKTSKLRVIEFCAANSPVTGEFPAQRASDAENVSISKRHHECEYLSSNRLCLSLDKQYIEVKSVNDIIQYILMLPITTHCAS